MNELGIIHISNSESKMNYILCVGEASVLETESLTEFCNAIHLYQKIDLEMRYIDYDEELNRLVIDLE